VFLRFQLRHPQEMAEHFEPMVLRQPGQIGHGFGDKRRGLIPPPSPGGSPVREGRSLPADACLRRSTFFLAKKLHPKIAF
jgi:hypothetical protein